MSCEADWSPGHFETTTHRRARKPHRCYACGEAIRRGDVYAIHSGKYCGEVYAYKQCARCAAMFDVLCRRVSLEGEAVQFDLDCEHTWDENFESPPPDDVAALAFLTPDEAQAALREARAS